MTDTHYVIVVHGTWNPPNTQSPTWHQLDEANQDNFCRRLNDELEKRGLGRPVWRRIGEREFHFGWSGANKHLDRALAGQKLYELMQNIERHDPSARISLVSHSHGGNVALVALQTYLKTLRDEAREIYSKVRKTRSLDHVQASVVDTLTDRLGADTARARAASATVSALFNALTSSSNRETRQNASWEFAEKWWRGPDTNRISRLVFMGTPFLSKIWKRKKWWDPKSLLGTVVELPLSAAGGMLAVYCYTLLFWALYVWPFSAVAYYFEWLGAPWHPQIDPRTWSYYLIAPIILIGIAVTAALFNATGGWKRRDVNVYFDLDDLKPVLDIPSVVPYPTLTIHAGYLDEALLSLSGEPIVYGALSPQIEAFGSFAMDYELPMLIGQKGSIRHYVFWVGGVSLKLFFIVLGKALSPLIRGWQRRLSRRILQVISSSASGVSPGEFADATIDVKRGIFHYQFFQERNWDVGRLLVASPARAKDVGGANEKRYQFLWDDTERERRARESWLWEQLQKSAPAVEEFYRNHPALNVEQLRMRLVNTCLVLEERAREVIGMVDLVHAMYYSNSEIINEIAGFLADSEHREGGPVGKGLSQDERTSSAIA